MLKRKLVIFTLAAAATGIGVSTPAAAGNPAVGALIGGGVGSAIGGSINGPNGAWVGGAVGAIAGAAIAANSNGYYYGPPVAYAAPVAYAPPVAYAYPPVVRYVPPPVVYGAVPVYYRPIPRVIVAPPLRPVYGSGYVAYNRPWVNGPR